MYQPTRFETEIDNNFLREIYNVGAEFVGMHA